MTDAASSSLPADQITPGLFIDGRATAAAHGDTFAVYNPATGDEIGSVANGTVDDALVALDAADRAAESWAATAPRVRGEVLRRAYELMIARADELAGLIVAENGKIYADAYSEVLYAADFFRWYSEEAVRIPGSLQTAPGGKNRILVTHKPMGISILVTPWNFPAAMATRKIGPAIAAGCTVVLKPASETPLTAIAIAELLSTAGVPDGVVNVITSRRSRDVVAALVGDPRTRKLSFTGSTEVGRELLALAGNTVLSTSMELGGNAPFIVFDDADVDAAVDGAMVAKMRNGGEACTAANRFYVQRGIAREFTAKLTRAMAELTSGNGADKATTLGPIISEKARADIAGLVDDAVADGATLSVGGSVPDGSGFFYPATVLADTPTTARILTKEIFGPVAPVVTFDDESDAIRLANATEYGLVSYLFTGDLARGLRVAEQLESGMVGLNRGVVSDPAAPFGGVKQSGLGREGGAEGMLEYLESQYIAVDW